MKSIDEISRMDLSKLGSPGSEEEYEADEAQESLDDRTGDGDRSDVAADSLDKSVRTGGSALKEESERMAEPEGEHYYIDAKIGKEELGPFIRRHMFLTAPMILMAALGVFMLVFSLLFSRKNLVYALLYIVVVVLVLPIVQYRKTLKANLENPVYAGTLHYMLDEWGLHIEAANRALDVEWKNFLRYKDYDKIIVLYTGKTNAYILPKKDMDSPEQVLGFLERMSDKSRQ